MTKISELHRRWSKAADYAGAAIDGRAGRFARATRRRLPIVFEPDAAR